MVPEDRNNIIRRIGETCSDLPSDRAITSFARKNDMSQYLTEVTAHVKAGRPIVLPPIQQDPEEQRLIWLRPADLDPWGDRASDLRDPQLGWKDPKINKTAEMKLRILRHLKEGERLKSPHVDAFLLCEKTQQGKALRITDDELATLIPPGLPRAQFRFNLSQPKYITLPSG